MSVGKSMRFIMASQLYPRNKIVQDCSCEDRSPGSLVATMILRNMDSCCLFLMMMIKRGRE